MVIALQILGVLSLTACVAYVVWGTLRGRHR